MVHQKRAVGKIRASPQCFVRNNSRSSENYVGELKRLKTSSSTVASPLFSLRVWFLLRSIAVDLGMEGFRISLNVGLARFNGQALIYRCFHRDLVTHPHIAASRTDLLKSFPQAD